MSTDVWRLRSFLFIGEDLTSVMLFPHLCLIVIKMWEDKEIEKEVFPHSQTNL